MTNRLHWTERAERLTVRKKSVARQHATSLLRRLNKLNEDLKEFQKEVDRAWPYTERWFKVVGALDALTTTITLVEQAVGDADN